MLRHLRFTPARIQRRQQRGLVGRRSAALVAATAGMVAAAAAALAAAGLPAQAASPPAQGSGSPAEASAAAAGLTAACPRAKPRQARCLAYYRPQAAVNQAIAAGASGPAVRPRGWGAGAIESAYKLPISRDTHQTVAVVDAQSTPHLAADLAFYRRHYGLPPCTAASGCLRIVNQAGHASPLPAPDPLGWGVEETLDVAMVSAACPLCKIDVVEAKSPSFADLAAAEDTAARLGAQVISNSYGATESGFSQAHASAYHHPGHAIVASSGDSGFGAASFPANLATVIAVGGTQLARASNARGWTEQVWDTPSAGAAASSGCSAYVAKPSWQHDPGCPGRTTADVAALAWNITLYDTSLRRVGGPWITIGGTSAAAPIIAGVYGLAGNAAHITPAYPYRHRTHLFDITTGNNALFTTPAAACGRDYLCLAKRGYDAPTGLGTPNGTAGF